MASKFPYIFPVEQVDYGIPDATPGQIDTASRLVNSYLGKPEGLIWVPDANGFPAYMGWKEPTVTYKLPVSIAPGNDVIINFPGALFTLQNIGEMVILDRCNTAAVEACNISVITPTSITLQNVQFAHNAGATVDLGMTIVDESPLPQRRTTIMLSRTPVARVLSGYGRYGFGRRGSQYSGVDVATNLLAYVAAFGGPPQWTQFPLTDIDINAVTGVMWCPPGLLLAYFSDVRIHYVAGWPANHVPSNVKQAVANLVRAALANCYGPNIKMVKAGNATIENFANTLIDSDTKQLLDSYRVKFLV